MNAKPSQSKPYADFDFDLAGAVQEQVVDAFKQLPIGFLAGDTIEELKARHGVYQLFLNEVLVYIGKAKSLKARIKQHRFRLSGRTGLTQAEMGFKCLYVHRNWTPLTHEESLIRFYQQEGHQLWNGIGFGSNDPGRNREQTDQPPEGFHRQFPINAEWPCDFIRAGKWNVNDLLKELKRNLPFLLRYQDHKRGGHADFTKASVTIKGTSVPLTGLLASIGRALPAGWQVTEFPSHVILYKEDREYGHGRILWPIARHK